ncbi:MAG: hypothetical protein JO297_19825 [Nitrososphaeraceae archaeon]|nr:hypothetical protein [Nitrososphaeraceae archaeon]
MTISLSDFFQDDLNKDYKALPSHELDESPCKLIIGIDDNNHRLKLYLCKMHPKIRSIHLSMIEHHIKYVNLKQHEEEIVRQLSL